MTQTTQGITTTTIQFTSETEDIRDINPGEVYYAIASKANGGRCVNNGCFRAVWRTKADAKTVAAGNPDFTVVKCLKPDYWCSDNDKHSSL